MSTKVAVAVAFTILFSLGLAFEGAPDTAIILCASAIILGSALPDLDRMLECFHSQLRVLLMLLAGVLFAYSFSISPSFCYFFHVPACPVALPLACAIAISLIFLFDFFSPAKPPFHTLTAMALSSIACLILTSHLGFIEYSFLTGGAFAAAFAIHIFLEGANVDRSHLD